ncbi:VOC family protein [Roseobacter litoralis]|uniref:VOC domain-containing protein n=1 Tax=Roseobacter litoralis (strain ATCC 49566 / DSM 6996 / JCM 21268 / NBRC 15278 / OCh 149) TaxID=391595 RepID=F7ZFA1_ROSLO|nr:VOC family protein [Roseobacter litoralis]AEI94724.1 hypothetical protein RLO149_c027620 [Roseobacter litoralis Och 149]
MPAQLEHANFTVSDAHKTALWMQTLFGWDVRWQGPAIDGGLSLHIGTDTQYLALYQPRTAVVKGNNSYNTTGGLNHIALVVDDIDDLETKVTAAGFSAINHADYSPGRRFYFHDHDGIEYEIVQYD